MEEKYYVLEKEMFLFNHDKSFYKCEEADTYEKAIEIAKEKCLLQRAKVIVVKGEIVAEAQNEATITEHKDKKVGSVDELVKDIKEWRKPTKREEELAKVKDIVKDNFKDAPAGMFFTRNWVGDPMETIFAGVFFTLDICRSWGYFELFGVNTQERQEIEEYYDELKERWLKE